MEDAPLPIVSTPKETISQSFEIKQDNNTYKLNINVINQDIILNILDEKSLMREYEIKISLNELKQIHKIFLVFSLCQEFIDYIKALIDNQKISVKKENEKQMTIELMVEYLYKQNIIKIDLFQKAINFELISLDLYKKFSTLNENFKNLENNYKKIVEENKIIKEECENIKKENKIIKEECENTKKENKNLKEENISIKDRISNLEKLINSLQKNIDNNINKEKISSGMYINSSIIENNELDFIISAIQKRMNKEIKEIRKLYQAPIDGFEPEIFHKKCNI